MCHCFSVSEEFEDIYGYFKLDVRNQLNHDKYPGDGEIPMEPIEVPSLSANDPTVGRLLPQPHEADEVFDNRHSS